MRSPGQVARIEIELAVLEIAELSALSAASRGERCGAQASLFKIKGTEIQQRLTELALEAVGICGPYARRPGELHRRVGRVTRSPRPGCAGLGA
jgi:alkylation response protein AidB-like acyl-CoA dehydrogenase